MVIGELSIHRHTSFIVLPFTVLHRYCVFNKLEAILCVDKVYQSYFSNSIWSLNISVSHFGNSLNMPNIFIIMPFTVICDQWS